MMDKFKWKTVIALEDKGEFDTFKDAAKTLISGINVILQEGVTHQVLETTMNVVTPEHLPIGFYDVRDICIEAGWLDEKGKWLD